MKTFEKFTEKKRTEKAILISAFVPETTKEESFWLPLSKVEISGEKISIDETLWQSKIEELKNPTERDNIIVESSAFDKGDKATKLIVEVLFNENAQKIFIWMPNSQIIKMEEEKDEEETPIFKVTLPKWLWESTYKNSLEHQLEFWNKEETKYTISDFKLLSKLD